MSRFLSKVSMNKQQLTNITQMMIDMDLVQELSIDMQDVHNTTTNTIAYTEVIALTNYDFIYIKQNFNKTKSLFRLSKWHL